MEESSRVCIKCYERKPIGEFHSNGRGGRRTNCKECHKEWAKSWWKRNGVEQYRKQKDKQLAWRKNNPERYAARQRKYHLRRKYAMTDADFQALVVAQGGKCACCGTIAGLVIDHDHASGSVRSLLCQPCNKGLGCFYDDPAKLRLAAEYLEKHNEQ